MLMKPNFSRDANLLPASSVGGFGAVSALKKLKSTLKAVITKVVQKSSSLRNPLCHKYQLEG